MSGTRWMAATVHTLPSDVDPSADEARRWLLDELAKPEYEDRRSFLTRLIDWVADWLNGLTPTGNPDGLQVPPVLLVLGAVLVVGAIVVLLTRLRGERAAAQDAESRAVLGDLDLSSNEFRDRGLAALREGRWGDAVVELVRALAREAADRTLLQDAPSLTAHEVGTQLAPVFPEHEPATRRAMDLFDAVRYGRYAAREADALAVRDLEATLRKARPNLAGVGTGAEVTWGVPQ